MLESLGATDSRHSAVTEKDMYKNLFEIIDSSAGRVIIGTFASQVSRIGRIIEHAESVGKKIFLDGYSMKMNIGIAKDLGYIKAHKDTIQPISEIGKYPASKVVVICTGAQGEGNAVLSRIISDEHRYIKIKKEDTVIFSSSVIPGNERTVQRLKDKLYRKCDNVIHSDILDVHVSGHSGAKEIQEILRQIKPGYFLPVYANHYFLKEAAILAVKTGFKKEKIFVLDNGSQLEFRKNEVKLLPKKADTSYVMVDGLGIGDVSDVVLKDRQMMSEDGIMVVVSVIDKKTMRLKQDSDIISRGFVYMKESKELIQEVRRKTREMVEKYSRKNSFRRQEEQNNNNDNFLKNMIRDEVSDFLFYKTQRRPMVIPVIIKM
ncbi:MAG: Ribocuclease J [Parcubacteria group bacterium GW2011_GWC1_45_9]|nr:MAG: Ribocuclease J [Parcubacteria group bacterium GW2011_GWC1_45_9]